MEPGTFPRQGDKETALYTVNTNELELMEGWFSSEPSAHFRANFALWGGNGAVDLSAVYIDLEPGGLLGEHRDSPEELLFVVEGDVEFTVGTERGNAGPGVIAIVPAMAPHSIRNIGDKPARILGVFPAPAVEATFAETVQPLGVEVMQFGDVAAAIAD